MSPEQRIIPVFVPHLGCPNNCVFCNQRKISGAKSAPSGEALAAAVEEGLSKNAGFGEIQLAFYGGSFTAIPPREQEELLEGALPFLRDGRISSVRVSTRPDAIDGKALDRLERYGVKTIELGAQSMCAQVLEASGRGHSPEDTERASALIKARGFRLILQMMTGLPTDTKERSIETARRLIAMEPDGVRIYPTVVLRDTPMYDMWQQGLYTPHSVEQAVDWCAEILPMFESAGIPVIRLGLNPSEELSSGQAAAGAYHPAFGELVRSRLLLDRALSLLNGAEGAGEITLLVNKSDISAMVGQKRCNIKTLAERFPELKIKISEGDVPRGEIVLRSADNLCLG